VVARAFAGQIEFENNSSKQQAISEARLDSGNKESSVLFNLILPLIGGFAVSGCGITLICCSLYRCGKTPPVPPSPTSEACVRKQPKQSEPKQKAKSKAISAKSKHPKHSKQDESCENQNEHQDDVTVDDLPDTWLVSW